MFFVFLALTDAVRCSTYFRYYCPNLGSDGYPKWVPHAVAQGACKSVTRSEISNDGPFPAGMKVLFYGNSYMRQVRVRMQGFDQERVSSWKKPGVAGRSNICLTFDHVNSFRSGGLMNQRGEGPFLMFFHGG